MEKFTYLSKTKLNDLPKAPGVYALSSQKTVLYIGKAANLKERVKNHFMQPTYRDDLFIQDVKKIGYIKTESDIDALLLESQLIKKQQPRYNVMWKDDKKYFYVAITKETLPRIFLTHQPALQKQSLKAPKSRLEKIEYIGPFIEGKAIKQVLRLLRKVFPYYTAKNHGALLCQYCHLNLCPGPTPNKEMYKKNIRNLVSVLKGKKTSVQKQLKKEMESTAKSQDFEKAAELRDQFLSLESIISHARLLAPEVSPSVNWIIIEKDLKKLFSIKKRITRIEAYDISNIQGKEATGSQVTFLKGIPAKEHYRNYKIHITGKPNDFAMMEELLLRRLLHKEWPYPQIIVIDGGKGQLTSAINATLNISAAKKIKIVALAKKQNELFFPGKSKSVLLRDLPRPSENLFLHIRDEAHRFAITYHRLLHRKKVLKTN
jgi:excinuclease ABC subunit C